MRVKKASASAVAAGAAAVILLIGTGATVLSEPAAATAQFAKDTGKACGECHTNAKGGGPLTPFGAEFKANGNKMIPRP